MTRCLLSMIAVAGVVVMTAGCSGARDPSISLVQAVVSETTNDATAINVTLEVTNPNDVVVELREVRYRLAGAGQADATFRGRRAARATLQPHAVHSLRLPVIVRTSGGGMPSDIVVKGSVEYLAPGEIAQILYDYRVRRPKAGFTIAAPIERAP